MSLIRNQKVQIMFSSRLGERKENDSNKNFHISRENNRDLFDSFEFL